MSTRGGITSRENLPNCIFLLCLRIVVAVFVYLHYFLWNFAYKAKGSNALGNASGDAANSYSVSKHIENTFSPPFNMWDDVIEEDVPAPAEPEPAAEAPADAAAEAAPEEEPPAPQDIVKGTEPKKLVFKHWIRPKFLQYNYLYRYQRNYYDDVINYLDQRNRGLAVEKPRAQTWGERALRTYLANSAATGVRQQSKDASLLRAVSTGARFHRYHSKSLIARKYSRLGFNTVSI